MGSDRSNSLGGKGGISSKNRSSLGHMNDEVMMREIHMNVGNPGFAKKGVVLSRIYALFVA